TLGIAVFSGMLGVTIFGVIFTPVFFYVIRKWTTDGNQPAAKPPVSAATMPADQPPGSSLESSH
ncbi:MAG TPA: hypothetical protein VFG20_12640, partial [Planctomycetaceae bacterium]|nr:hypothetical protein [Planctomycetaceae bacterium]